MVIDRLIEQIKLKKNPCIVGIDPEWSKIPECYKRADVSLAHGIREWATDIRSFFNEDGLGALISSSRGILYHHEEVAEYDNTREMYMQIVKKQAQDMQAAVYEALNS